MPKKDDERQEEEAGPDESEICDPGNGGGRSLPEEALVSFGGTGPERRMAHGGCSHSKG